MNINARKAMPKKFHFSVLIALIALFLCPPKLLATEPSTIAWRPWSAQLFSKAVQENKLILLNLEAVWCHWCHVMDQQTYASTEVSAAIAKNYIAVKVDHDADPELASRFRAWGWPATIIFNSGGQEIVKRAGYIPPQAMLALLAAVVKDPRPEAATITSLAKDNSDPKALNSLSPSDRQALINMHQNSVDPIEGGLAIAMKFIDPDSVEYALLRGLDGDQDELNRANKTLTAALALEDPVWSGFYQYSTHGDWQHPHYEKLMRTQSRHIRLYAQAYAVTENPVYLKTAESTLKYINRFLRAPNGAYYTSQDADLIKGQKSHDYFALDDRSRLALGTPAIDQHQYSNENAQLISALAWLYRADNKEEYRQMATHLGRWLLTHRSRSDGGYRHDANADDKLYLSDNIAVLDAFLDLYEITADRQWLTFASHCADAIHQNLLINKTVGIVSASARKSDILSPHVDLADNIVAARAANRLFQYSGRKQDRQIAESAMRFLANGDLIASRLSEPGILLADTELSSDPLHLTIVGAKSDPIANSLYQVALASSESYLRIEWWDRQEGKLPNHDVDYPTLPKAAAFVCNAKRCSTPVYQPEALPELIRIIAETNN
jgi:uncharacterized protein YyaL (SSP411 family)